MIACLAGSGSMVSSGLGIASILARMARIVRIAHAIDIVRRSEGDPAIDQGERNKMLQADVGHLAIVDDHEAIIRQGQLGPF